MLVTTATDHPFALLLFGPALAGQSPTSSPAGKRRDFCLFFIWPGTGRAEPDSVARRQKARLLPATQCRGALRRLGNPVDK